MAKKHAKKKDLDYLNDFTKDRLQGRGLLTETSVVDTIKNRAGAPMLPGLREYLPTPLLINLGRRALFDIGREWQLETKSNAFTQNKLDEFFKFTVKKLNVEGYAFQKLMNEQAAEINKLVKEGKSTETKSVGEWLRPQDMKDVMTGLSVFMVDAFAVGIATKSATDTADFMEWFLRWTNQLLTYWPEDIRSHGANLFNGAKQQQGGGTA